MFKIVKILIASKLILMTGISMSFAYTVKELEILAEDCETSLALQRQFQSDKLVLFRNIQLRSGDNCADIVRQLVVKGKSVEFVKLWDKMMTCTHLAQDIINENGGLGALPLPDHITQQYVNYKIDGKSCLGGL